ncbi:hypothetical protein E0H88_04110 [Acinetobacter sp. ANC 4216]|uniref:hypothetical protein n=1 Tax=Acinetobacter sp. ANC 4216 TaxID=2529840 RepID=UPI00103AB2BE|nr:hypothetical protein [Acinetobacter sp. ANC 4216]TCB71614.1 hypothetical protein E0H88_04110 [Acinetobacter sp. ANC 4216]
MNLIEKLGGYGKAKRELELKEQNSVLQCCSAVTAEMIRDALLEYRRQHNIFEVGDKVVFRECSGIGGASDAIDLMTVKSIDAFGVRMTNSLCPWAIQIRHATDAEITAGKRLEVD